MTQVLNFYLARPLMFGVAWVLASQFPTLHESGVGTLPAWLLVPLCLLVYEGVGYVQHRLIHHIPCLWRISHSVHHESPKFGVFLGIRVHYLDFFMAKLTRVCLLNALGVDAHVIQVAATISVWCSITQHAATCLRFGRLNYFLTTPEAHLSHHEQELRVNYCFGLLSVFDHLGGTFFYKPERAHGRLGIEGAQERSFLDLLLCRPLRQATIGPREQRVDALRAGTSHDAAQ